MIYPILFLKVFVFSQPAFICSKLTIETLEQDLKYVQQLEQSLKMFTVNNKDTRTALLSSFSSLFLILDSFHILFFYFSC